MRNRLDSDRRLREPLSRLAARYLLEARHDGRPHDPVARFLLGNGARVERVNWLADSSQRGLQQSFGLMVNYRYDPDAIENNGEAFVAFVAGGAVAASATVRRQTRVRK